MFNRRTEIVDLLVSLLKNINGAVSPFNAAYMFKTNLFNNVYRQLKFLNEVNDFPSLYLTAGTEFRNFHSQNLTEANLSVIIRAYVYGEDNSQNILDKLIEDIEHVIYAIQGHLDMGILNITIKSITTDEGVALPYGMAEVEVDVLYRLEY